MPSFFMNEVTEWKWTCCHCFSSGGMDIAATLACPMFGCFHLRCQDCPLEIVIRYVRGGLWGSPSRSKRPESISPSHESLLQKRSQREITGMETVAQGSIRSFSSTEAANSMSSNTQLSITNPLDITTSSQNAKAVPPNLPRSYTPISSSTPSVKSKPTRIFTPQISSSDSQSNSISTSTSPEDEETDLRTQNYEEHALDTLESRLLTILDNDLDLAARLLPRVFAQTLSELRRNSAKSSTTVPVFHGTQEHTNTQEHSNTRGEPNLSSTAPGTCDKTFSNSHSRKRGRSPDEPEEPEKQQDRPFKKPKPISGGMRRKFACHFYKRDPAKYDPRIRKYRSCAAPSVPELRRIKEHFEGAHGPFHCGRCWETFHKPKLLMEHSNSRELCIEKPSSSEDGLNDHLWREIVSLVKARRGLVAGERERHEIHRWYDIWRVLFPGVPEPSNPWTELPSESLGRVNSIETIMAAFQRCVDYDVEQGALRRDDAVHQCYISALRRCLEAEMPTFNGEFANLPSTSAPEFNALNEAPLNTIHVPNPVDEDENLRLPETSTGLAYTLNQELANDLWDLDFNLGMETIDAAALGGLWDDEASSLTQCPEI